MKFKEIECISFVYYFIVPHIRYAIYNLNSAQARNMLYLCIVNLLLV